MNEKSFFSVIVPVYNSEFSLFELVNRITVVFQGLNYPFEIILVDDNSFDNSWNIITEIYKKSSIKIIRLSRNFGQHNAILCGFNYAQGDYIITLDDDLQHPPEEIPKLIHQIDKGYNVVYGKYPPKNSRIIENIMSKFFQKMIHRVLDLPDSIFLSSFGIYQKNVISNIIKIKSSYPFIFGLVAQSTPHHKIGNIDVIHHDRSFGRSNYGMIKYIKYSLNLILNYSSWPLILISYIGFFFSLISFLYGLSIMINKILDPTYGLVGWNSLMVAITFIGGLLLLSMGIIGEYLKRILIETSYGQQYIIEEMKF